MDTYGPVFADVLGAWSVNLGCISENSLVPSGGQKAMFQVGTVNATSGRRSKMWLKNCEAKGQGHSRVVATGGDMYDLGGFVSSSTLGDVGTIINAAFTPSSLVTPSTSVLWYDAFDENNFSYEGTFNTSDDFIYVGSIKNKFDNTIYTATPVSRTQTIGIESNGINGLNSFHGGSANGYLKTGYFPSGGTSMTIVMKGQMPAVSNRSFFGCNDSSNKRFYLDVVSNGTLRVGFGSAVLTTTKTFATGDVIDFRLTYNGTVLNVWINGVKEFTNQSATFTGTSSTEVLFMCRGSNGNPTQYMNRTGLVSDFFIFKGVMSDQDFLNYDYYTQQKYTNRRIYRGIILKGQSNTSGVVAGEANHATTEKPDFRIHQIWRSTNTDLDGKLNLAYEPLKHVAAEPNACTFGFALAKLFKAQETNPNIHYLLVPTALGNTGYNSTSEQWRVGDPLHEDLILRANLAAQYNPSTFEWIALTEILGERDSFNNATRVQYSDWQEAATADIRSEVTKGTGMPYITSGLVPEFGGGSISSLTPVELAIQDTPTRITRSAYINTSDLIGFTGDNLHFNADAHRRFIAPRMKAAIDNI